MVSVKETVASTATKYVILGGGVLGAGYIVYKKAGNLIAKSPAGRLLGAGNKAIDSIGDQGRRTSKWFRKGGIQKDTRSGLRLTDRFLSGKNKGLAGRAGDIAGFASGYRQAKWFGKGGVQKDSRRVARSTRNVTHRAVKRTRNVTHKAAKRTRNVSHKAKKKLKKLFGR